MTVRLQFRPGAAETNKRVRVASVEFGADGQLASVVLLDGAVRLVLPASAFEKRLVMTEPIAIVDGAKKIAGHPSEASKAGAELGGFSVPENWVVRRINGDCTNCDIEPVAGLRR